jgi:hypothetical protein
MKCYNQGFGNADKDCNRLFVDCDTEFQPQPFIATRDIRQTRFRIAGLKVWALNCWEFCSTYGLYSAVVDTKEKYETVYNMTQKTNKEHSIRGNYLIGLSQGELISETI